MAEQDPFPWHLGVFDAHCHPTDTYANLCKVPSMKAKVLTVMATRAEDQELVARAAGELGITPQDRYNKPGEWRQAHKLVPAFGWHPWFSHQMFISSDPSTPTTPLTLDQKIKHYQSVLTPPPDVSFCTSAPEPLSFSIFLAQTKAYLQAHPLALIGEVGLDKSFRIATAWLPEDHQARDDSLTPGGREGRKLSPYRVDMVHQKKILLAQLSLAGEMGRSVSCHGVAAHGVLFNTLSETWKGHEKKVTSNRERKKESKARAVVGDTGDESSDEADEAGKPFPPRLCLHSFSGPSEQVKMYTHAAIPCEIFFSFSSVINFVPVDEEGDDVEKKQQWERANRKTIDAVKAVPGNRLLVESDLHVAGDRMDGYLEEIVRWICQIKGWGLEEGTTRLGENWRRFVFG